MLREEEDFGHVLDFCCQLSEVTIEGNDKTLPTTNIIPNSLPLHLGIFKTLHHLCLQRVNCSKLTDLGPLRQTLKEITVNECCIQNLADIFLCDQTHKLDFSAQNHWKGIVRVTISKTSISSLDQSTEILPNLKILVLNQNKMADLSNLPSLNVLTHLSLKNNNLQLHHPLDSSKLVFLDLSENKITTLFPFRNLLCLENLNLQMNKITDVTEVRHISHLQRLENLVLTANPVSQIVDYRVKVFEFFAGRAYRLCLDNENADQKELDRVAMLKALHTNAAILKSPSRNP